MAFGHGSSTVPYVHWFVFFLLSWFCQVLTRRGRDTRFHGRSRGLAVKQARSICGMHWLDSAVDEDYEACPNMAHVAVVC
jgi:hypothetical protein